MKKKKEKNRIGRVEKMNVFAGVGEKKKIKRKAMNLRSRNSRETSRRREEEIKG